MISKQPRVTLPCPVHPACLYPRQCTADQCLGWPLRAGVQPVVNLERKVCTYCGQEGHRAHACPRRQADEAEAAQMAANRGM